MHITSVHNPKVKAAAKLRDRRERERQRRLIIDGRREIACALAGGFPPCEVFYRPESAERDPELAGLVEQLRAAGASGYAVTRDVFARLAFGDRDEGLVVVAEPRERSLAALQPHALPLVVVLSGVEKPGNVGAVMRSADAAGASAVILTDAHTDLFNPNVSRASLGAVFTLPTAVAPAEEVRGWLRQHAIALVAARVDAQRPYFAADYARPVAMILGSEAHGLSRDWCGADIEPVYLPMHGRVDSLNVSVAAAILLYEAVRQRWQPSLD